MTQFHHLFVSSNGSALINTPDRPGNYDYFCGLCDGVQKEQRKLGVRCHFSAGRNMTPQDLPCREGALLSCRASHNLNLTTTLWSRNLSYNRSRSLEHESWAAAEVHILFPPKRLWTVVYPVTFVPGEMQSHHQDHFHTLLYVFGDYPSWSPLALDGPTCSHPVLRSCKKFLRLS